MQKNEYFDSNYKYFSGKQEDLKKEMREYGTTDGTTEPQFENPPWIISSGCIAGTKEGEGPIGHEIDLIGEDDNFGCDIWEEAESTLQKEALTLALEKPV